MSAAAFYTVWAVLGAAGAGLWVLSRRREDGPARPSAVARRLATGPLSRIVLVVALGFAGWHFFAR
jgi:hypothetical protein